MTRSRDIADQQENLGGAVAPFVSGKNFAINGGFDISQRGTSFTIGGTAAYTLDRWYASGSGGATTTVISQQTTGAAVGTTANLKATYSTNTTFCNMFSAIEYQNVQPLQGRVVTLSFKGRRSSGYVGGLVAGIQTGTVANTLTGGTWTEIANCTISNANLPTGTTSADWGSASVTITIPAGTQGIRIRIGEETFQSSGAYYEVSSIQLEIGSAATPFARAGGTMGGELALCQRYYWRSGGNTTNQKFGQGLAISTTQLLIQVQSPVAMRVAPSALEYASLIAVNATAALTPSAVVINNAAPLVNEISMTVTGATVNLPFIMSANSTTSAYLALSAEL
jgi:hypothetical protein